MEWMKTELGPYAVSRNDIAMLRELTGKQLTVTGLARNLEISTGLASKVVKGLLKKGFITETRKGSSKEIKISTNLHAQLLLDLIKRESNVAWENILPYSGLNVLLEQAGLSIGVHYSRTTKWRVARDLGAYGQPGIRDRSLQEFLNAYADYMKRDFASRNLPAYATILWNKSFQYFFRIPKREALAEHFLQTSISVFPNYGIELVTDYDYYFYDSAGRSLTVEDYILHTFLVDLNSPTYVIYGILLLLKVKDKMNRKKLMVKAKEYGLVSVTKAVLDYLDTEGEKRSFPLPPYAELLEKASLYGVKFK